MSAVLARFNFWEAEKAVPDLNWIGLVGTSHLIRNTILRIWANSDFQALLDKSLNPCYMFILLVEKNSRIWRKSPPNLNTAVWAGLVELLADGLHRISDSALPRLLVIRPLSVQFPDLFVKSLLWTKPGLFVIHYKTKEEGQVESRWRNAWWFWNRSHSWAPLYLLQYRKQQPTIISFPFLVQLWPKGISGNLKNFASPNLPYSSNIKLIL